MKKKKKLNQTLKVQSFVTLVDVQKQQTVKGGWEIRSLKDDC